MSMFRGRHRSFCSCALPQLEIELQFTLEVKRYRSARQSRAEELRVSRLLNSIRRRLPSLLQLEIGSSWLSTKFSQELQLLMASSHSTRYKQLRLSYGVPQRDPRRTVQPRPAEVPKHEGTAARSPAGQRHRRNVQLSPRKRIPLPRILATLRTSSHRA